MADDNDKLPIDEEAQLKLLEGAVAVKRRRGLALEIDGAVWCLRPTSMKQNEKMTLIDFDIMFWQRELKDCKSVRRAKRLHRKIRQAYAKKAAHKVLGKRLGLIPFAHAWVWRKIYRNSEAVSATINSTESIGENKVFYLANLGSSKQALALCMQQVGESVKELTQRMESAENMVRKDGLPTKAESK